MKNIVVAYDTRRGIGKDNDMPWRGHIPSDMRHFVDLTRGHTVLMGRKTFESIGRPLPKRRNIVLSRTALAITGVEVARSLEEALALSSEEVYIIGGQQVYTQALPFADRVYATEIDATFDADAHFPPLNQSDWTESSRDSVRAETDMYSMDFVTYERTAG